MMMFTKPGRYRGTSHRAAQPLCTRALPRVACRLDSRGDSMAISMHSASVPVFVRMLGNMTTWLDKAEAHAAAKKFEPSVFLAARLAPDMLAFTTQVQIACDAAKFCVARLTGTEAPKF